jgi:DNA-binding NarL/FixJ family response regulator
MTQPQWRGVRPAIDWPETVSRLLKPMPVQTFLARNWAETESLAQHHEMHVMVLDSRLTEDPNVSVDFSTLLQLVERVRPTDAHGEAGPLVIVLATQWSDRLLREALRRKVFSVLPEPVDVNELLDTMAKALRRVYGDQWPA